MHNVPVWYHYQALFILTKKYNTCGTRPERPANSQAAKGEAKIQTYLDANGQTN